MKEKNRICIIGIDGATFDLIKPWAARGYLPNIQGIIFNGSHGILKSSIPDNSAPAWTSIVTGKNPGKHRVFGFTSPGTDIARIRITNSLTKASSSIWDVFGRHGRKVCVINVPLTYPPEEVDGIMISGMDTPNADKGFTYPESLKKELNERFGRYRIEPETATTWTELSEKGKMEYIAEVHEIARLRCRVASYLLKKYPWDFFMVVFVAADRIQHKFWGDMDSGYPFFPKNTHHRIRNAVLDTYRLIDSLAGEIAAGLSADASLAVVSDHGFGPRSPNVISVNRLLNIHGLLKYKTHQGGKGMASRLGSIRRIASDLSRRRLSPKHQQRLKALFPFLRGKAFSCLHFSNIDWEKTKAFADEPMGLVWINRKYRFGTGIVEAGEEYEKVCDDIVALLKGINDPDTGLPVFQCVCKKQDVYSGPFLSESPDIVFSYSGAFSFPENRGSSMLFKDGDFMGRVKDGKEFLQITGTHRPDGIIILSGKNIRKGVTLKDADVTDVAPTCLFLAGLPVSADIDGRVLTEAIDEAFIRGNPVEYESCPDDYGRIKTEGGCDYSQDDQKQIKERLKNLGYL
ncbi:alkaline phosphatase family protein [bacterium]|nr:alkaline phosphatase family protein [bacterium]